MADETNDYFRHELSAVEPGAEIGRGTRVWAFAHVLPGAVIGDDCNICDHVFVESDVVVGDRVTVKCGVQLWNGVRLEDDVFLGPNATFTNDLFPRSRGYKPAAITVVEQGASVGANATVLPGVRIGRNAMIGAGTVVVADVPANAIVVGNPGRIVGYVGADAAGPASAGATAPASALGPWGKRGVRLYESATYLDLRGSLSVIEASQLPFVPARFFTVYDVPSKEVRGEHAHRSCAQLLTCMRGSVRVLWDDGDERGEVLLDRPSRTMLLPALVWGSQFGFSSDAVLHVAASLPYDADDYIRTYGEFLDHVRELA